jgi:hypothetical protein
MSKRASLSFAPGPPVGVGFGERECVRVVCLEKSLRGSLSRGCSDFPGVLAL